MSNKNYNDPVNAIAPGPHAGKNLVSLKTAREIEKRKPSEGDLPSPPAMKVK